MIGEAGDLVRDWHLLPHRRLTFTHGDPRVDNILFEPLAEGVGAVIIDWQVTGSAIRCMTSATSSPAVWNPRSGEHTRCG